MKAQREKKPKKPRVPLSEEDWQEIIQLPADKEFYEVKGVAFAAAHYPATWVRSEFVIAATKQGVQRREYRFGKWLPAEMYGGQWR